MGAEHAIEVTGKDHPRHGRDGRRNARIAKLLAGAIVRGVGVPEFMAGGGVDRMQAGTAQFGIIDPGVMGVGHVIDRHEHALAFGRHAEMHAALRAAMAQPLVPPYLAGIRVDAPGFARFLADDKDALFAGKRDQQRRCGDIEIRPVFLGTGIIAQHAADVPRIVRRQLRAPDAGAGPGIDGENRIGIFIRRAGVIFARSEIDPLGARVIGGAAPHRRARRAKDAGALQGLALIGRRAGGIGAPDFCARCRVERQHRSPEGAAGVFRIAGLDDFERGNRHIEQAATKRGRAGDRCRGMVAGLGRPQGLAGHRIERMGAAEQITEIQPLCYRVGDDGGAHFGDKARRPAGAAGFGVERVDGAILAADEKRAPGDQRLRARPIGGGIGKGPFQREARHFGLGQARDLRRDKAGIVAAPSDGLRHVGHVELRTGAGALGWRRSRLV